MQDKILKARSIHVHYHWLVSYKLYIQVDILCNKVPPLSKLVYNKRNLRIIWNWYLAQQQYNEYNSKFKQKKSYAKVDVNTILIDIMLF